MLNMEDKHQLFPISIKGRWGYIDIRGRVVIKPQFLSASKFREGLARVSVSNGSEKDWGLWSGRCGFIAEDGKFVIPPEPPARVQRLRDFQCYSYSSFHEGLARIHINDATGMDGFINPQGKLVVPCKFHSSADFSEGLAFAETWRAWRDRRPKRAGYIDTKGRFVIENSAFRSGHDFADGRAVVYVDSNGDHWDACLINKRGKFVIPPGIYSGLSSPVSGAMRAVRDGNSGMLNVDGDVLVPFGKYHLVTEPSNGSVFTAESRGKVVLLDPTGKRIAVVRASRYVGRFSEGMATICIRNRFGYIDATGKLQIPAKFRAAEQFDQGLAFITFDGAQGYINRQGELVWRSDHWTLPPRNSVSKPLSAFLPESTVEALPLSYNWEGVKNAIVFVADESLEEMHSRCKKTFSRKGRVFDGTSFDVDAHKLELTIYRNRGGHVELYAMAARRNKEEVKGFINFYHCRNMMALHKKYPKNIIGILIEN
jgi:hypothetical protein